MKPDDAKRAVLPASLVAALVSVASSVHAGEHLRSADDPTVWYHWPTRQITYHLDDVGDQGIVVGPDGPLSREEFRAVVERAFAAWTPPCTDLTFSFGGWVTDRSTNMTDDQIDRRNTIIFRRDDWDETEGGHGIAVGLPIAERGTGRILDADIDVNAGENSFTLYPDGEPLGDLDLQSVLTNQIGRLLGLADSSDSTAVMFPFMEAGEVRRDLAADDLAILCETYPAGQCTTIDDLGQKECPVQSDSSRGMIAPTGCSSVPCGQGSPLGAVLMLATLMGWRSTRR